MPAPGKLARQTGQAVSNVGRMLVYELDLMPEGKASITPYTCNRRKDGSTTLIRPRKGLAACATAMIKSLLRTSLRRRWFRKARW